MANNQTASAILATGLWWKTSALGWLIGLGPLLAASRTFAAGLALGLASLAVLCASNMLVSVVARWIAPRFHLTAFFLLIAALVTAVDLLFQAYWEAYWFDQNVAVGLFVPLIVTNCLILARAESFAAHHGLWPAFLDGLGYGIGFTVLLAGLGALRELLTPGLLAASLPAGTFFLLAALVALRQIWLRRHGTA